MVLFLMNGMLYVLSGLDSDFSQNCDLTAITANLLISSIDLQNQ